MVKRPFPKILGLLDQGEEKLLRAFIGPDICSGDLPHPLLGIIPAISSGTNMIIWPFLDTRRVSLFLPSTYG